MTSYQGFPWEIPKRGGSVTYWKSRCKRGGITACIDGKMAEEAGNAMFSPLKSIQDGAHCSSFEHYKELYKKSVDEPAAFWGEIAKEFYWKTPPAADKFLEYNFDIQKGPISIKWMSGGVTNLCYNVLDRNVKDKGLGDTVCFYW